MCNDNPNCPSSAKPSNRLTSPLQASLHTRTRASNYCATMVKIKNPNILPNGNFQNDWDNKIPILPKEARHSRYVNLEISRWISGRPCIICGLTGFVKVDHLIPICRGGDGSMRNLQPLCHQCNHRKHNHKTNKELWDYFLENRESHIDRHARLLAMVGCNFYDGFPIGIFHPIFERCKKEAYSA